MDATAELTVLQKARRERDAAESLLRTRTQQRDELLEALRDVVAIADRETEPFIRARALIARIEGR